MRGRQMKMILRGCQIAVVLFATPLLASDPMTNGDMIKECLKATGYNYEEQDPQKRLDSYNWNLGADCVSGFQHKKFLERKAELQEFLNEKPWFRGTNWKWQERAEYTCTKQHHTGLTVCQKPYYLN